MKFGCIDVGKDKCNEYGEAYPEPTLIIGVSRPFKVWHDWKRWTSWGQCVN